ncbi:MAG: hypothetical protein RML36_14510 [Anaerolineae bacterium]|nr:hypothetical protein [Anaerolineae bacterium]MDW8100682.1 hypothetical protein [Anaerolineae bacterium]
MSRSDSELDQLRALATLREHQFRSRVPLIGPLIARFREMWNNVSTRWYVWPLIQQQSEVNHRLAALLADHEVHLQEMVSRLVGCEAELHALKTRLTDHEGWLIAQDREQSAAIGDLNEVTLRLIHTMRRLDEVERRLAALEASRAEPSL